MGKGTGEAGHMSTPFITKIEMGYRARADFLLGRGKQNRAARLRCVEAAEALARLQLEEDMKVMAEAS